MKELLSEVQNVIEECVSSDGAQQLEFQINGKQYVLLVTRIRGEEE